MPPFKIVIDTNVLLRSISRRSAYAIILDKLYENAFLTLYYQRHTPGI